MNSRILLVLGIFLVTSCNSDEKKHHSGLGNQSEELPVDEGAFVPPDAGDLRKELVNSYSNIKSIDTSFNVSGNSIKINLEYYCLFDSSLIIPKEYIWEESSMDKFVSHNFASNILILKDQDTLYHNTVAKETFNSLLTEELRNYGALRSPSFRRYDEETNNIVFHFSITIPVTDIGTSATLYIDLEGNETVKKY